jgi:predicted ATPase
MSSRDEQKTFSRAISRIAVSGFKSIQEEQEIELRPLTILAGANSSGKSTMMQLLLLLKQTLEAAYDPGPLLLRGPNVEFSEAKQMFFHTAAFSKSPLMELEIQIDRTKLRLTYSGQKRQGRGPLELVTQAESTDHGQVSLSEELSSREIIDRFNNNTYWKPRIVNSAITNANVLRNRCFLEARLRASPRESVIHEISFHPAREFATRLEEIVHLPGLRGNPAREYPVSAIGKTFPGTFQNYVASAIAHWSQSAHSKLDRLGEDLASLGLTWKVETRAVDDTRAEIRVGRLIRPGRGAAKDLVNIADVGFGVSQTLPVVVALLAARPGQLVFIEQPEIHLHPRAQVAMADLLANAAKRGVRVVVETHSSLLLLGVQSLVAAGTLPASEVALHWFSRSQETGATTVRSAELDEAGRFGDWPEDFDQVALEAENRYLSVAEAKIAGSS